MIPALSSFQSVHRDLQLEIVTDVRHANLTRREADLAIRLARPKRGSFIASRIGQMESGLFASDAYLARQQFDCLNSGKDQARIGWDETLHDLPLAIWLDEMLPAAKAKVTATSLRSQVEAVRAGLGIAALPTFMATGMVRLGAASFIQDVFLITHEDTRRVPRIQATMEFLREIFRDARHKLLPGKFE